MADIQIKIKNIAQIRAAFSRSPLLMAKELNLAIAKVVLEIGRQSRQATPVDTGRLRASHYERFGNLRGEVGTNTSYDLFVHDGTRYMRARPYLRTAVEGSQGSVDKVFGKAVQNVLDSIGRSV